MTVRVPATSANLGPGFDSFGLALARYDEVTAPARIPSGLVVEVTGVGAGEVPLTARASRGAGDAHGVRRRRRARYPDCTCAASNCIPHGGGLGSSAAAIVAGLLLGRELIVTPAVAATSR